MVLVWWVSRLLAAGLAWYVASAPGVVPGAFSCPRPGRGRVAKSAAKITAKAVGRVLARHAMTRAAGFELPFDQFACEVAAEVVRLVEKRAEKDLRRTRAVTGMVAALTSVSAPAPAAEHGFSELDPARVRLMLAAGSPVAAGVPRAGADPESN